MLSAQHLWSDRREHDGVTSDTKLQALEPIAVASVFEFDSCVHLSA